MTTIQVAIMCATMLNTSRCNYYSHNDIVKWTNFSKKLCPHVCFQLESSLVVSQVKICVCMCALVTMRTSQYNL